jgi:hypothetical protein
MRFFLLLTVLTVGLMAGAARSVLAAGDGSKTALARDHLPTDRLAIYVTGETLTHACRGFLLRIQRKDAQQAYDAALCYGFTVGVMDVISVEDLADSPELGTWRVCLPSGLNGNTAAEIVGKFAETHPELRTQAGYSLVRSALAGAFPCH